MPKFAAVSPWWFESDKRLKIVDSGKLTVDSLCHFPVLSVNYQFSTVNLLGSYQSGQMGLTVTQLSFDFGGSNPSLPTK